MKSGKGTWIAVVLTVTLPLVAFISIECVQRYRCSVLETEVNALIRDIQAEIRIDIGKDGRPRLLGPAEQGGGSFEIYGYGKGSGSYEEETWHLTYLFADSATPPAAEAAAPFMLAIRLQQERRFLLLSPRLSVDYTKTYEPLLAEKVDALIRARGLSVVPN